MAVREPTEHLLQAPPWASDRVVRTIVDEQGFAAYHIADTELPHGTSLGNASAWATSKGTGAIESIFSIELGQHITGSLVINYFVDYTDLSRLAVEARHPIGSGMLVRLQEVGIGEFFLHPAYQRHRFTLTGDVGVEETFFLPRTGLEDPCLAYHLVRLENRSERPVVLAALGSLHLTGDTPLDLHAEYDARLGALVAWNRSHPDWVRVFGCPAGVDAHLATTNLEDAWHPSRPLPDETRQEGDLIGALQVVRQLNPGATCELTFVVAFSPQGRAIAERAYHAGHNAEEALRRTIACYRESLDTSEVLTPDELVNEGAQWAKANMLRVLAHYPTGTAFTNDPGRSSHVVARDAAWFIYGCDYLQPEECCRMLHLLAQTQEPSGMIVEYYDARTLETADYGLNINDATPLFLMAAAHHLKATGHTDCANHLYGAMVKAADYLLSQRDERGLVFCTSRGTAEHGICGWRNVMPGVTINGAVTEVNSEAYAGLGMLADVAEFLGRHDDKRRYDDEADHLRQAIEKHLKNPENGLYYLNIDADGHPHSEVTADLVFPLICSVADEETARLISDRLNHPDFMSSAGLRTISRLDPRYTPEERVGLQGGVWPGVTWWYAISSLQADPGLMIESLRRSYRQYVRDPRRYNTVPGQFSEWFDGEALQNRGMRLSPWEPPRFLWALLEGAIGVRPTTGKLCVEPTLPANWQWVRVRNFPYHGHPVSWFLARYSDHLRFYTTNDFDTGHPVERFDEDISQVIVPLGNRMSVTALAKPDEILVCVGSTFPAKQTSPLALRRVLDNARRYQVEFYSSETARWSHLGTHLGGGLERFSVDVEGNGFVVCRLRPE